MDENIIQCIYKSCDQHDTNSVAVSSLISFIKPYMANNEKELVELKLKLDPGNSNPQVDCTFFQQVMSDWIANIQADDSSTLSELPVSLHQSFSSPPKQMSTFRLKSHNNNTIDEMSAEEQLQRLTFQLNKATTDLNLVREQLTASEDQNEALLAELNLRKMESNRHSCESRTTIAWQSEDIAEVVDVVSKKCEQLEKMLSDSDKQQEKHLTRIVQLENENVHLKKKVQSCENMNRENRKSVTEMRDTLDVKESEISTLMEIIDNLKCELEQKTEVANFYEHEHKLYRQKTHELETLLKTRISHNSSHEDRPVRPIFNTPKLLRQLANPVTPNLSTPKTRRFETSSPVKNVSFDSLNSSVSEVVCNVGVVSVLRSPHKNLKEELAEISFGKLNSSGDEVDNVYKVAKDQEDIKNHLWENMKKLSNDNEMLLDYKKEYLALLEKLENKDRHLREVTEELELMKQKMQQCKNKEIVSGLNLELNNLENQLLKQKLMGMRSQIKLRRLQSTLSTEIKKQKEMPQKKDTLNKSTQSDVDWVVPVAVSEHTESKHTNYAKLQLKIDRLLERKESLEKDLSSEKTINVKLTQKWQEKNLEMVKITNSLQSVKDQLLTQQKASQQLTHKAEALEERLKVLTTENANLATENARLKDEVAKCIAANQDLEENLCETLKKLALEVGTSNQLRVEIELSLNAQCQMKDKIQEDLVQQFHLKKQINDLQHMYSLSFKRLQAEFVEKCFEIRTLKKEIEVGDGRFFLYTCCEELCRTLRYVHDFFNDDDLIVPYALPSDNMDLENQMIMLHSNITSVTSLLENVCNKHMDLSITSNDNSEICHSTSNKESEDSFVSCSSEFWLSEEVPELRLFEFDSFLDNLEMDHFDVRNLSKKEMEEKFTTLALILTVDLTTLNKRNVNEKDKFQQTSEKFFSLLNYSMHLLDSVDCHPQNATTCKLVSNNIQLLKETSYSLLRTAVTYGILDYEYKVANCWKLLIKYVAVLSQENKMIADLSSKHDLEAKPFVLSAEVCHQATNTEKFVLTPNLKLNDSSFKLGIYVVLFLLLIVIGFILYVDQQCPKTGKQMCPIEWIISLFVEKTHTNLQKFQL